MNRHLFQPSFPLIPSSGLSSRDRGGTDGTSSSVLASTSSGALAGTLSSGSSRGGLAAHVNEWNGGGRAGQSDQGSGSAAVGEGAQLEAGDGGRGDQARGQDLYQS
ncbi:hypothetical protein PG993_007766 [Apiospora rasikravindrae]|uniref:Uncharacterized protein n=1 Tax=Apiospora rasikravindrae TaxID=990691 RepID=A0ABR1SYF7_9PEZI